MSASAPDRLTPRRRSPAASALLAAALLLLPLPLYADWRGRGRASGTVAAADGTALADATITLRLADAGAGPPPVRSDQEGRWAVLGLAAGRWQLRVEAPGFVAAEGWVDVPEGAPGPPLAVLLRPLVEETPGGAENPFAVIAWLERANSLLAQGQPAAARGEYEKALATLPESEHPPILQAVARTWYLEGDRQRAVTSLEAALRLAPADETARQLLRMLWEDLGRPDAADAFLASLSAAGSPTPGQQAESEAAVEATLPPELAALLAAPAEPPVAGRAGSYKVAFGERSPWSAFDEVLRRAGRRREEILSLDPNALSYPMAAESFQVRVPAGEPPPAGWGLMVWSSPGRFGGTRRPDLQALLDRQRLIWVGANEAGNERPRWDRWGLALDAAWHLQRLYPVDPARVYVSGFSGGGRTASALALLYPDVFRGAIMVMGIDWYRDLPVPDHPGAHWPAPFARPPRELLRLARERSRMVLITGEKDFNRMQTRVTDAALRDDGFRRVTFLEVPGMTHYDPVPEEWLRRAYEALDPLPAAADPGAGKR